ncbi:hypothetical protein FOS14_21195 [Skermania sp. ID1734]|uniref:hypothetical protein n=1 Tax=Skermania sp. ID1734 TaxID=2597516 RepID=UPI00117BFF4E|nr:hypothetical protein [Skermania sp. ID1734]TSD94272.1 hypothetical protein FOS14_21195 [Skermania sp. ID1734]
MDEQTVDRQYAQLQQQAQQTAGLVQALAGKLSAAAAAGDQNAREWQLDLKEIAIAIRDEESSANSLLQAIHALVDNHVQSFAPQQQFQQPAYQQPVYQQPASYAAPQYQSQAYPQGGGALHRFLGSGFGQAIMTGAGFGIGDDIVNDIFDR